MSNSKLVLKAVRGATKKWTKQRKAEEKSASQKARRRYAMTASRGYTVKEAANLIMEKAYMKASANGKLPAHARQVMYAARPMIAKYTDKPVNDQYFIQTLLADYMWVWEDAADWNVVFDARGHLHEPHTKKVLPLGTLDVRNYLADAADPLVEPSGVKEAKVKTAGPAGRYNAILFIEKEGFMPLFQAVKLAERYDIAIMSTKGMSVTAARELVDRLCAKYDIPLLVLHDFDKSGFSIVGTLSRDTRRYRFEHDINVIDIGLRLADIEEWGLEYESVGLNMAAHAIRRNLKVNGATEDEIEKLMYQRVELNAFASDDLISWIENKLEENGIEKVVPDDDLLAEAYREAMVAGFVKQKAAVIYEQAKKHYAGLTIDENFTNRVLSALENDPEMAWDDVVFNIARERLCDDFKQ